MITVYEIYCLFVLFLARHKQNENVFYLFILIIKETFIRSRKEHQEIFTFPKVMFRNKILSKTKKKKKKRKRKL